MHGTSSDRHGAPTNVASCRTAKYCRSAGILLHAGRLGIGAPMVSYAFATDSPSRTTIGRTRTVLQILFPIGAFCH